jgi:predicted ABC-type ATPase
MPAKRMRVFAGPNGSGKTTIFKALLQNRKINLGAYVNADEIELELSQAGELVFEKYQVKIAEAQIVDFFKASLFSPLKRKEPDLWNKLKVRDNVLSLETHVDSYLAADIAEFLRQTFLKNGISFTYETVMSHEGKVEFLAEAKKEGYKVYLYYIATEDPDINNNRVNVRVAQKGHAVAPDIIKKRYYRSLDNLRSAVKNSNRAYIFDNSGEQAKLVAEITEGVDVLMNDAVETPSWVVTHLLG